MMPVVEQPLDPLAGGRFGQPDGPGNGGVGPPAILLELLDDPLAELVQSAPRLSRITVVNRAHSDGF